MHSQKYNISHLAMGILVFSYCDGDEIWSNISIDANTIFSEIVS
jgi:hypothetical protein